MKMIINNKTKIFVSVSKFPGNTGALLHNAGYKLHNLNNIYIPLKCKNEKILKSIIFNENFKGISISMPYKTKVIKYLDKISKNADKSRAVNTIIRTNKLLYGFNTDYTAIKKILVSSKLKVSSATIIGSGSTSKTVYEVLKELKLKKIFLTARKMNKFKNWIINDKTKFIKWEKRSELSSDILINCTPLGMKNNNLLPIKLNSKNQFKLILDLPINDSNKLSKLSKNFKIKYICGKQISLIQGIEQYNIYNNKKLVPEKIKKILKYNF